MPVSFCWVSVDPSGGVVPYSTEACLRLEAARLCGSAETSVLVTESARARTCDSVRFGQLIQRL